MQGETGDGSWTSSVERASHPGGCQQAETPHDLQSAAAEPYPAGVRPEVRGQDLARADEWDPSGIPFYRKDGRLKTKGLWSLHSLPNPHGSTQLREILATSTIGRGADMKAILNPSGGPAGSCEKFLF
ncbi:hypothetical protein XAP6164_5740001 [Xanthomonas phaseoli pv. phaseoli]|uniref:Uncharacterized protein n=1 Tax=Xanthomonas campestris pv. phaseoli TaxID=317013 RepID=A0AB38DWT1_XANCH|nr:conserved hypothetical protein [Xanthomonas phaseoli pv. phaseoli]SON83264.1 conserved hypothetical protein [Xanthomonas phaseoli pv. phaseoli]SOO31656.1 hypothetical protein XAP6164_5740001 [Xanthomonas phaseoli pv. phaseoli]